jgi:hypothetical protein
MKIKASLVYDRKKNEKERISSTRMVFPHVVNVTAMVAFGCLLVVAVNNKCKQQDEENRRVRGEQSSSASVTCPHSSTQCSSASTDSVKLCPYLAARSATQQTLSIGHRAVGCAVENPVLTGLAVGSLTMGASLALFFKLDQRASV